VPRLVIGSVNLAEFFVTTVVTATFVMTIGLELWPIITGLVLGGSLRLLSRLFSPAMCRIGPSWSWSGP
jgi:xanthine/uracil permease